MWACCRSGVEPCGVLDSKVCLTDSEFMSSVTILERMVVSQEPIIGLRPSRRMGKNCKMGRSLSWCLGAHCLNPVLIKLNRRDGQVERTVKRYCTDSTPTHKIPLHSINFRISVNQHVERT